jgi:hypothetical protein
MKLSHEISLKSILAGSLIILVSACGPVSFKSKSNFTLDPANGGNLTPASTEPTDPNNPTNPTNPNTRDVVLNKKIAAYDNQVDILMVMDDSNSMLNDNVRLANRMSGFVSGLESSGLNFQVCVTNTSEVDVPDLGPIYGARFDWVGLTTEPRWIMTPNTPSKATVFENTIRDRIGAGWANTNDERGILAAKRHFGYRLTNNCYRTGAALSVILISDEDERGIAGDESRCASENCFLDEKGSNLKALTSEDQPQTYVNTIKAVESNKRLSFNSIIVKPGDTSCKAQQDAQLDEDNNLSLSHYGTKYAELSNLTGGHIGSICDPDYATILNNEVKNKIQNSMAQVTLECSPVGNVDVVISPPVSGLQYRFSGNNAIFDPAIPEGRDLTVNYKCAK